MKLNVFMRRKLSILVLGDSIAIHYLPYLKTLLANDFTIIERSGIAAARTNLDDPKGANCGDSRMMLSFLRSELPDECLGQRIVALNCGLHDIRTSPVDLSKRIGIEEYRDNLHLIFKHLLSKKQFVLWINTTPVADARHKLLCKHFLRFNRDVLNYNKAAEDVARAFDIPTANLHDFTKHLGANIYCDHVHFIPRIRLKQGEFVAAAIRSIAMKMAVQD